MKVLFFAKLREDLGVDFIDIDSHFPTTVESVRKLLAEKIPHKSELFLTGKSLSAVNKSICDDREIIQENDEVAFFPPVTGG